MAWMSPMAMGSMPAKGSSRSMNDGEMTSARVISTRRRSPPDSVLAFAFASAVRFSSASSSPTRARRSARLRPSVSRMARMFCSTVSPRKMDGSCGR